MSNVGYIGNKKIEVSSVKAIISALTIATIIFIGVSATLGSGAQQTEAEKVARTYMTAFFHSDIDIAVSLMHPVILEQQKANIAKAYDEAKKQGKEKELRSSFEHIGNLDSLLQLPTPEFWSTLMKKDRERAPAQNLEAMKKSVVKVIGSETIKENTVKVKLQITTPTGKGESKQEGAILLSLYNGKWRVVEGAK